MNLKNEAQFIEFEEEYIQFEKNKEKFFAIGYENKVTRRHALFTISYFDLQHFAKEQGFISQDRDISFASTNEINYWIKIIAREELNIQAVLSLEKLQRGYGELREELERKSEDMDRLTLDFAEMSMELIRTKVQLVTANKENRLVISQNLRQC
jgi:hypothetical protein